MTQRITLSNNWVRIAENAASCLVLSTATASVYIGSDAPDADDAGFNIKWGVPIELTLDNYGGSAWVRGVGSFTYVSG